LGYIERRPGLHGGSDGKMSTKLVVLTLLMGASLSGASLAQTVSKDHCREVALRQKPGWTLSGAWQPDGSLIIVDALWNTILRYSSSGESLGPVGEPLKSALVDLMPVTGQPRGSDFILEVSDGLMVMSERLRPIKTVNMLAQKGEGWAIGGYWQWFPAGKDIVAYVDVVRGTDRDNIDNWKSAFVRFSLDNPAGLTVLSLGSLDDRNRTTFLRSGSPYIASLGDTAYVLKFGERIGLYKNERGSGKLEEIKGIQLGKSPQLPQFKSAQDYVDLMAATEKVSMPVGLYGWNNSLYVLSRSPGAQGTRWFLTSINPAGESQGITGKVELPIQASHVTVVPGPRSWAFVEKGPVKGYGVQDISRVLLIPSHLLRAPLRSDGMVCRK